MQEFTGKQYLQIDIANCYGLDRLTWNERLFWFDNNEPQLEQIAVHAKNPILFRKAVRAWRQAERKQPINHIMGLDATSSGLQILATLSGCIETGKATNLVFTGRRECAYDNISCFMQDEHSLNVSREQVKPPVMTVFYGSKEEPKKVFGEGDELAAFYTAIQNKLPGAYNLIDIFLSYWQSDKLYHSWTMPDGHRVKVPVTVVEDKQLEIDEMDHMRVTYRSKVLACKRKDRSLAANIVHSIDGWIVRQMVAAAHKQGYWLAPIHDCFYTHPNHMNDVRANYIKIMTWLARNNLLQKILSDIAGYNVSYFPMQQGLEKYIPYSEYALS